MTQLSDDVMYEQMCEDYRSLNGFLWQIPLIVTTLNGGLWFSVANFPFTPLAQANLLMFAALADLLMIAVLWRVRVVLNGMQGRIFKMDGRPASGWRYIVVICFTILLGAAAVGSWVAAQTPSRYFTKPAAAAPEPKAGAVAPPSAKP